MRCVLKGCELGVERHLGLGISPDVPGLGVPVKPIHLATYKQRPRILRQLLRAGASVDSIGMCNKLLSTPLQLAAMQGQHLAVELLLSHLASPIGVTGTDHPPPIVLASRGFTAGHVEAVQLLREADSPTEEALKEVLSGWLPSFSMVKALVGNRPVVTELLEPICKVAARHTVEHDDLEGALAVVKAAAGNRPASKAVLITTALQLAAREDNPLAISKLLKAAGSSMSLQHVSFTTDNFHIFSQLVHAGARCDFAAHEPLVVKLTHEYENIRAMYNTTREELEAQRREIDQLKTIPENLRQALFLAIAP
jgi:ankyrin repeat protein